MSSKLLLFILFYWMGATLRLDTSILQLGRPVDLLHYLWIRRSSTVLVVLGVADEWRLLVWVRWETAHGVLYKRILCPIFHLVAGVCVGLRQAEDGVRAVEKVDHAGAVVNPQKVHEKSDHHVFLGLTWDLILPGLTNSFKFYDLKLLRFVQVLKALGIILNFIAILV